jgi:hypothetical protein
MKQLAMSVVAITGLACGTGTGIIEDESFDEFEVAESPLLGADGKDAADRACNVVLRSLARIPNGPGFTTSCTATSGCSVVWGGFLDVSSAALAEGAVPFVMYKNQDATNWTQVRPTRVTGGVPGYQRYRVTLQRNTMSEGMSATALSRARIDVAPFIRMPNGARLFDKQRGQTDFENYTLSQAFGWVVTEDASVCAALPVPANLAFLGGFSESQQGALVAGGKGIITYSLDRLPACRGTHNGFPAWDITAFVRFSPGNQVLSGSVRGFSGTTGTPSNESAVSAPWTFDVPRGATSAEVWFRNFTGAGSMCESWDSKNGANYQFAVASKPYSAVQWVGRPGSSTSRACARSEGAPDTITLDSYLQSRACVWVEADVYVPGLTDGSALAPYAVFAEVQATRDGVAMPAERASFIGRFGNDYRYQFQIPKSTLFYGPKWTRYEYSMRFSTDGRTWTNDVKRAVVRDVSFCNPAWSSCAL